jgi:hypothetical protein
MNRKLRRVAVFGVAGIVLVVVVGVAYAVWTSHGAGTGRSRASAAVAAVVNPANGDPDLYPGFTEGDLAFTVANPNDYPVNFTDMAAGAITSSDEAACPGETWIVVEDAGDLNVYVPPGDSEMLTIDDVVAMDADAPDGCQNAYFDIEITLTGFQTSAP